MRDNRFSALLALALFILGFLIPWWPLTLLGLILLAMGGRWVPAFLCAFFLDVVYGVPPGHLHILPFPFTFLVCVMLIVQLLLVRYVRRISVY